MYELRVLTGLHRGAALPLVGLQWEIGNEEEADLVLFDPGIKPQHCSLVQREDGWVLSAKQGKITDAEGHKVDIIEPLSVNHSFALNGIWMTIVEASTPWPQDEEENKTDNAQVITKARLKKKPKGSPIVAFILGFFSAGAIVATSTWAALSPAPVLAESKDALTSSAIQQKAPLKENALPSLDTIAEVKKQLQRMMQERELGDSVHIETEGEKVRLTGSMNDIKLERVVRMLARFHQQYQTPFSMENKTTSIPAKLPFKIAQITSGSMGSIITNTGKRLFVGDELNGMRLVSISDNKVIFKGKQDYEVTW